METRRLKLLLELSRLGSMRAVADEVGFATAMRRSLLPLVDRLRAHHPDVLLRIREHEPDESFALLADDDIDLALVYDYNLAPVGFDPSLNATPLWSVPWSLGIPSGAARSAPRDTDAPTLF